MLSILGDTLRAIVRLLPPAIARFLLLAVAVGALLLHVRAIERIAALELWRVEERAQNDTVLNAIQATRAELAAVLVEVRGYREDQREELKRLRQARAPKGE